MRMMRVLVANKARELVQETNNFMIEQKDVVSIIQKDDQFIMFYYQ